MPDVHNAWDHIISKEKAKIYEKVKLYVIKNFASISLPLELRDLFETIEQIKTTALSDFSKQE